MLLSISLVLAAAAGLAYWYQGSGTGGDGKEVITVGKPGPWGVLESTPIRLEVSDSMISADYCITEPWQWTFTESDEKVVQDHLLKAHVAPELARSLMARVHCSQESGCVVKPTVDQVVQLSPRSREYLYRLLGSNRKNTWILNAMRTTPSSFDATVSNMGLDEDMVDLARSLSFRWDGYESLADIAPICSRLSSQGKRQFLRTFFGVEALLVKLRIRPDANLDVIERYWSGVLRSKDAGPLLESLHNIPGGTTIDVIHLMPAFPRELLNTFPEPSGQSYNCHWSSLNFFSSNPEDRYLDDGVAGTAFNEDYRFVTDGRLQLGDILLFITNEGEVVHSAVQIADNIVFSKNGLAQIEPWVLTYVEDVFRVYSALGELRIQPIRRRRN